MTEAEQDVEKLVVRAQGGDVAALGALYDLLAERVYRFALFRLGSPADAEDLVQRTFVKMMEALPRYQQRGIPFEAWFFRLARNGVIDQLRGRRSHEPLEALIGMRSPDHGPEDAVLLADEFARIEDAMQHLTASQREVIAYRFMAGLTLREIAYVMRKREGTVRALQFRGLEALRRSLSVANSTASREREFKS
jgi:RNA polymerase sigma-70 factor (ECF subfamily)